MNTSDPKFPIPIRGLSAAGYPGKTAFHYRQIKAGRLIAHKMGRLTIVLKEDADRWLASLPKMLTAEANPDLESCVQGMERVALAVAAGRLDRDAVIDRFREVAVATGLMQAA